MSDEKQNQQATDGYIVRLVVSRGALQGKVFNVEEGNSLIGRWDPDSGAFPEIDLTSEDVESKISRKHAVIDRVGREVTLSDIGSLNGTFLNRGPRLEKGAKMPLKSGDEVIVGKTFLRFELVEVNK